LEEIILACLSRWQRCDLPRKLSRTDRRQIEIELAACAILRGPNMPEWLSRPDPIHDYAFAALMILALAMPRVGDAIFAPIERCGIRLANRKSLAVIAAGAAAILLRLSIAPFGPLVPVPHVHDEMSYLLAADTFAHGRLTNPAHPQRIFFDTIHVNQLPTYMSKYPPAQGAVLAIGQLLGRPWIGVLLSVAAMCAAILWMLQGWMPARWALLGGVLVIARFAAGNYWIDSYWGGAVAATGGALALGALPRIIHHQRARDGLLLGLGAAILANSRPFEGVFFFLPVAAALLLWLVGRRSPSLRITGPRVVAPVAAVLILTAGFIGYYNWRLTGHALLFPYVLNNQTYSSTPNFVWQDLRPSLHYANAQFDDYYNNWMHSIFEQTRFDGWRSGLAHEYQAKLVAFQKYFLPTEFWAPIAATLFWLVRDRKFWQLFAPFAVCFAALTTVVWFEPHYAAPLLGALIAILVQALRHLRKWTPRGRPTGIGLSRAVVLFVLATIPFRVASSYRQAAADPSIQQMAFRAQFLRQLEATPGDHLVLIHYGENHDVGQEWVYNRADINHSKVIWARAIPEVDTRPLLTYFRNRMVWDVDADSDPPRLSARRDAQR
jgi:hypothetical protein